MRASPESDLATEVAERRRLRIETDTTVSHAYVLGRRSLYRIPDRQRFRIVLFDLLAVRPSAMRAFDSPAGLRSPFFPIDLARDGIEAARLGLETADLLPRWPVRETIGLAYRRSECHHRPETNELRSSSSRRRVISAVPLGPFDLLSQSLERVRAVRGMVVRQ
jgi:hypothetical protein